MVMEKVASRIREFLEIHGLTEYELSNRCSRISRSSVYNAVSGDVSVTVETLADICEGMGIPMRDVVDLDPNRDLELILSEEERCLVENYRKLNKMQVVRLTEYLKGMMEDDS